MTVSETPLAHIRHLIAQDQMDQAQQLLADLMTDLFDFTATSVTVNRDGYSLNSANGFVSCEDGRRLFFKFHQEEGEEAVVDEYYRAELLEQVGYPVDGPLYVSKEPGRQILIYPESTAVRLADICIAREKQDLDQENSDLQQAQAELDRTIWQRYQASFCDSSPELSRKQSIHQLFYHRLVDQIDDTEFGGRVKRFYQQADQNFLTDSGQVLCLNWDLFKNRHWVINGVPYQRSVADMFDLSKSLLHPDHLAQHPAVTAHGDAHNANVWYHAEQQPNLRFFDPAFAGTHIPALLAEIKATFHNIFAHPYWLYDVSHADHTYQATLKDDGTYLHVTHNRFLGRLREEFLTTKIREVWIPLITHLHQQQQLPENWQDIMRCALFCCPTLVMNLTADAGAHTKTTSALGWANAVMMGSPVSDGTDPVTRLFTEIDNNIK